jgi:hypothetical protein
MARLVRPARRSRERFHPVVAGHVEARAALPVSVSRGPRPLLPCRLLGSVERLADPLFADVQDELLDLISDRRVAELLPRREGVEAALISASSGSGAGVVILVTVEMLLAVLVAYAGSERTSIVRVKRFTPLTTEICTMTRLIALMSVSLDRYVADATDGVEESSTGTSQATSRSTQ